MKAHEMKDIVAKAKAQGLIQMPGQKVPVKTSGAEAAAFGGVKVSFETISPDLARHWLANNLGNRRLRSTTVSSYVRDMRAGDWITNHQGIAFRDDGTLIDGQHRLHAIAESDVSVTMMVSRGWPMKAANHRVGTMDTVDVGAGRSLSDLLQLQHGTENPRVVTMATRSIALLCCRATSNTVVGKMSISSTLLIAQEFAGGLKHVCSHHPKQTGLRRADVLGPIAMAYDADPGEVSKFLSLLTTGESLSANNPILTLRNYLISQAAMRDTKVNSIARAVVSHLSIWMERGTTDRIVRREEDVDWLLAINPAAVSKVSALFGKGSK